MKRSKSAFSAIRKWLFVVCNIAFLTALPASVYADGGYVEDDDISVPANSYTTFSTVYNGKRYYLGVDTTAKGVDTLVVYDQPCYQAMWIAGPLWSPTGEVLPRKNYTRTVKSVWTAERCNRDKYLAVGPDKGTYSPLVLANESGATMWYTAKDFTVQSQHMYGYVYYYSEASGVDVYRYVTYDPLFGFSRLYSSKPALSQLISVWDRKTGNDLLFTFTPLTHTFGLETEKDTTILPVTAKVTYYMGVDRFRSRSERVDIHTTTPTVIDDQLDLVTNYNLFGYYEWASNPRTSHPTSFTDPDSYDGNSHMKYWTGDSWVDTTLMHVRNKGFSRHDGTVLWYDTLYAIGTSPFDMWAKDNGDGAPTQTAYADHSDWLRIHFRCGRTGEIEDFVDSALLVRQTFHDQPFATLTSNVSPTDKVFPFFDSKTTTETVPTADRQETFTLSVRYTKGNNILYTNGSLARMDIGQNTELDLTTMTEGTNYTLNVEALNPDGTDATWVTFTKPANNQINAVAGNQPDASPERRTAQLKFTLSYMQSSAVGDTIQTTRSIWVTQKSGAEDNAEIYAFRHKDGLAAAPQSVHTKTRTIYAVPGEEVLLPIHRDHWGYYRWYEWDYRGGAYETDPAYSNNWSWVSIPTNQQHDELMPINHATSAASRGRWDVGKGYFGGTHYTVGSPTPYPIIKYPERDTLKTDSIACDVSAYTDIVPEGTIGVSLTKLTEPTLSYRQIFDIQPAKTRADSMTVCRTGGRWMENHTVVVPANRDFILSPKHPVDGKATGVKEGDLQYIYYFNPTRTMGTGTGLDTTLASSYGRVGKTSYTGSATRTAQLLTKTDIDNLGTDGSISVLVVNARQGSGYVLGKNPGAKVEDFAAGGLGGKTTLADVTSYLESQFLNPETQAMYKLTLTKSGANQFILTHKESPRGLYYYYDGKRVKRVVRWITGSGGITGTNKITYSHPTLTESAHIEGSEDYVLKFYMSYTGAGANGYLTASNSDKSYQADLRVPSSDAKDGDEANQLWLVYKIVEPNQVAYDEVARWYKSNDGTTWTTVAHGDSTASGYTMLNDGSLLVNNTVLTTANDTLFYCLKTKNFQLAKFTIATRDVTQEGPSSSALIPEETLQNNYDILLDFSYGAETPGVETPKALYRPMSWEHSEMSYHYPTTGDGAIVAEKRVNTGFLPAKGEYAFINKFVGSDGHTVESMAGAKYGYMLCANASEKPVTLLTFEYEEVPCADQEIYLTGNLCNPVKNEYEPQLTATLEGWKESESKWIMVYRYKTGEIPYNAAEPWYQFVLPIDQKKITGYSKFRCSAVLSGSESEEAYLLMDRLRFVAEARPVSVFQNKTTCLESGHVDVIARIDYSNSSFPAGSLVAFQYQKKVGDAYVPLTKTDRDAYFVEGLSSEEMNAENKWLDVNNNPFGMIMIPDSAYNPSTNTDNTTRRNMLYAVATKMGDATDDAKNTRVTTYVNESSLVQSTMDDVPGHLKSYVNEGANNTDKANYIMYLACHVAAAPGDTFRVAMTPMRSIGTVPNFSTAGCATERIVTIKNPVQLNINGSTWTNTATKQTPNNTYRLNVTLTNAPDGTTETHAMFDLLRSYEADANYASMTTEQKAAANATFKTHYGVSRTMLQEALEIFRADNENNPLRLTKNWNDVRPEDFMWSGRSRAQADSIYTLLNRLIAVEHKMEIGLDYYDVYLGSNEDVYAYIQPLPASGWYIKSGDTTALPACNTPQWFAIHSNAASYTLRFGYDNRIEGNYQIPVIRATRSEANGLDSKSLKVRVAELTTGSDPVILGWQSTQVIESSDAAFVKGTTVFKYEQDKTMIGHTPSTYDGYYTKGSDVTFTPATGNTDGFALKAGHWYKFKANLYSAKTPGDTYATDDATSGTAQGHAEFILAIAPDTVRWTPSHPESANYWNDDDNWTAVVNGADYKGCIAPIPMGDSRVIIPKAATENQLPIVEEDPALVARRVDTLDYGFKFNTCKDILFYPEATMWKQHNLDYNKAYVDVVVKTGNWQTFSPALDKIYTGDIYVPRNAGTGNKADDPDFAPARFEDGTAYSADFNRSMPYLFYQGFYNSSVNYVFQNTDIDGAPLDTHTRTSATSADWVRTNALDQPLTPGHASIILGFGPTNAQDSALIVRLPKQEDSYHYIGKENGVWTEGSEVNMTALRGCTSAEITHNLAYDKTKKGNNAGITYTLTNTHDSKVFFFGNPTMSLIDVYKLCQDNSTKIETDGGYKFTAYQLRSGSTYTPMIVDGPGKYFVAPQKAVGLIVTDAEAADKTLEVLLTPNAMVAMTGEGTDIHHPFSAPKRKAAASATSEKKLYISASNVRSDGEYKAYLTLGESAAASRGFVVGEDVLSLSSGNTYYNRQAFSTPLTMYTIADNQALMYDVRDTLNSVPVLFGTLEKVETKYRYSDMTTLSFALDGEWDRPLYLYDAVTNDSILIRNGLQITVPTPESDQLRYFINGGRVAQATEQSGVATGIESPNGQINDQMVNDKMVNIYDILGRKVLTLTEFDLISNIRLPIGVYIIQRGNKIERMVIR